MEQTNILISQATVTRIAAFDQLPSDALLNVQEVSALAGRSVPSVWRDAKGGHLAKPIKIGTKSARWRVADVRRYLAGSE